MIFACVYIFTNKLATTKKKNKTIIIQHYNKLLHTLKAPCLFFLCIKNSKNNFANLRIREKTHCIQTKRHHENIQILGKVPALSMEKYIKKNYIHFFFK